MNRVLQNKCYDNTNMYDELITDSNFGEFEIDFSGKSPSYYYFKDVGIDICVSTREEFGNVRSEWNKSGVYILVGKSDKFDYKFYVGLSSDLSSRIKSHTKNKGFWNKVIIIKRSHTEGFTKSDIYFLESEIYKQLSLWKNAEVENTTKLDDETSSTVQKLINYKLLSCIFNFLAHMGIYEIVDNSEDLEVTEQASKYKYWCVRAGKSGFMLPHFQSGEYIAIDFKDTCNESLIGKTRDSLKEQEASGNATSQLLCFRDLIKIGDIIISPDPGSQKYYISRVISDYYYEYSDSGFTHKRKVQFLGTATRDQLTEKLYRSLRSILTVFGPSDTLVLDPVVESLS
jgi:hypothetical protein